VVAIDSGAARRRSGSAVRILLASTLLFVATPANITQADLFGPSGKDVAEKRAEVRKQRDEMLAELYRSKPDAKDQVSKAVGYATFKQTDVNLLLVASSNGYGVLTDSRTKQDTFMRVASLGGGLGAGIKDLRVVIVFNDADVMQQFLDKGWQFGGKADASAKYEDTGASADQAVKANVDFKDGTVAAGSSTDVRAGSGTDGKRVDAGTSSQGAMVIYQFTESGISLQATVSGTKYWKDTKHNDSSDKASTEKGKNP
jgi:lipid-binding SYLF domain-containing protein